MADQYYKDVHDFIGENFPGITTVENDDDLQVTHLIRTYPDIRQGKRFNYIVHKDKAGGSDIYPLIAGRSRIVYSNEVYIAFHVDSIEDETNDVKSFYYKVMGADERAAEPSGHARAARFCQYIGENELLAETDFGRKIFLDSRDISLTPHISHEGKWEPWVMRLIRKELGPGQTFFDIGANCGFLSLLAAHVTGDDGFVLAFEPQEKLADMLERSFSVNGFSGYCSVIRAAVGDAPGTAELNHYKKYSGSSSFLPVFGRFNEQPSGSDVVTVQRLDTLLDQAEKAHGRTLSPDFIKIDVEGYEMKVMEGMKSLLERADPLKILMEFTPNLYRQLGDDPRDLLDMISGYGFSIRRLHHDDALVAFDADGFLSSSDPSGYADLYLTR